jgi:hypothetical protein
VIITEKIDGTNAAVGITDDGRVYAQSRKRLIAPDDDNFGFARWVADNAGALSDTLGPGLHFGEWWGAGIQRRYGLDEKRFSLFNVNRWADVAAESGGLVHVVPVMYEGLFTESAVNNALADLDRTGSVAAPGFMQPEGIVVFHKASGDLYKVLLENDDIPKGLVA